MDLTSRHSIKHLCENIHLEDSIHAVVNLTDTLNQAHSTPESMFIALKIHSTLIKIQGTNCLIDKNWKTVHCVFKKYRSSVDRRHKFYTLHSHVNKNCEHTTNCLNPYKITSPSKSVNNK